MTATSYAEQARHQKAADAQALGIDDALISGLVEAFYTRARTHAVLGPIFASKVVNWAPHLGRMKDFWASIAIESGRFRGNPMLKHIAIPGLSAAHFQIWLGLWDETIADLITNPAAADLFLERAKRIATSLQTGIALHNGGLTALTKEKRHADGL
jgi:hemoglobin